MRLASPPMEHTHPWQDGIRDRLAEADRRARIGADLAESVARLTGVGSAADGRVTVTVDHRGLLERVTLTPAAARLDAQALGSAVVEASSRAAADVRRAAAPLLEGFGAAS